MEWIKIVWKHNHSSEPYEIYMELNNKRFDTRKVELFKNQTFGYAHHEIEVNGTRLNLEPFPSINEYNSLNSEILEPWREGLFAEEITQQEFEKIWDKVLRDE